MKGFLKHYLGGTDLAGTMALTLVVWLCSLVLVGLIVLPLFGGRAAWMAALALLVLSLALCWGICTYTYSVVSCHTAKGVRQ